MFRNRLLFNVAKRRTPFLYKERNHNAAIMKMQKYFFNTSASIHNESICIASINLTDQGEKIDIQWNNGESGTYHARWLFENCPSIYEDQTGQKISRDSPRHILKGYDDNYYDKTTKKKQKLIIEKVNILNGGKKIEIKWPWEDDVDQCNNKSIFDSVHLKKHSYSNKALENQSKRFDPLNTALKSTDPIPKISYNEIMESDKGVFQWTDHLTKCGICLVTDLPNILETIQDVASRICPTIETLYGRTFDVRVEENAINIAYTSAPLEPHMDLAYYESPPGIQMLHCLKFADTIVGGESTFVDTFIIADVLRKRYPEAFEALCTIPATFQKSHVEREHPAQMFYQRPHISTNHQGEVNAVFWSPPFEGPLKVHANDVDKYYDAYDKFKYLLLHDTEFLNQWKLEFRLKPGEMVTFNQRRMLHGRNGWEDLHSGGVRHLQGTYLNIDDFLNRYRYLRSKYDNVDLGLESIVRASNSSFS